MRPDDTVGALKERLHEALGIPPSQQLLTLCGAELADGAALGTLGIEHESVLQLGIRSGGAAGSGVGAASTPVATTPSLAGTDQALKTPEGRTIMVSVLATHTPRDVRAMVAAAEGVPASRIRLVYGGVPLPDDVLWSACGVEIGSAVHVLIA